MFGKSVALANREDAMPEGILTGTLLAVAAGLCNGSFFLPQRYTRGWQWENMWFVFATISQILMPWLVAWIAIPDLFRILRESPFHFFLPAVIAGVVWGVGMVTYGLGVKMVGIAAGNAVVASVATAAGTIGPMIVYAPDRIWTTSGLISMVAIILIIAGIYVYGMSGVRRERENPNPSEPGARSQFRAGMLLCLVTGVLGTSFIYGFVSSADLIHAAVSAGARPSVAGYLAWTVVFCTGSIPNLGYTLYRMNHNKSGSALFASGFFLPNTALCSLAAALWYGGVLLYGMGTTNLGRLGPSVGFGLYIGMTVLFGNLIGWLVGEWRGASRGVIRGFVMGMALILAGIIVIAVAAAQTG
jgi:L-rhamnose-H+ transport protein